MPERAPSKICRVCDQSGPALMAVVPPATLGAPEIQALFGEGLKSVPASQHSGHYTLRHLRGGYLYVFKAVFVLSVL